MKKIVLSAAFIYMPLTGRVVYAGMKWGFNK